MQLELAILSERGGRETNEDACGHWSHDNRLCCVVADGAGGHGGGQRASQLAVQTLIQSFAQRGVMPGLKSIAGPPQDDLTPSGGLAQRDRFGGTLESIAGPPQGDLTPSGGLANQEPTLLTQLLNASRNIIKHRAENPSQRHMHTTAVTLWIDLDRQEASWGHCGDSRLYAFRAGQLRTRTRDHSLVQSLVDAGLLKESELRNHPQRSELLSALGVDESELQISVAPQAWSLLEQDAFLLCTDGVWEWLDDDVFTQTLNATNSPQAWLHALQAQVLSATADTPRHDNYSALAVWVR